MSRTREEAGQMAWPLAFRGPRCTPVVEDGALVHPYKSAGGEKPATFLAVKLPTSIGNPCKQESFYTAPYFEGKFMYLRGEEYLYCIGGK